MTFVASFYTMPLNHNEIIDLALRYISRNEIVDFPQPKDLFCILERKLPDNKEIKDSEGWRFSGYGVCKSYEYDLESKPEGKWLWFNFLSLMTFPPTQQSLKLQPPHIAKGRFHTVDKKGEIKIIRIPDYFQEDGPVQEEEAPDAENQSLNDKIIRFPGNNR
jgi:hypothetical protein